MQEFLSSLLFFHFPSTLAMLATCWCFLQKKATAGRRRTVGTFFGAVLAYTVVYQPVSMVAYTAMGGFLRTFLNVAAGVVTMVVLLSLYEGTWYKKLLAVTLYYTITFVSELLVSMTLDVGWGTLQDGAYIVDVIERGNITGWVSLLFALLIKLVRRKSSLHGKRRFSLLQGVIFGVCLCCLAISYVSSYLLGTLSIPDVLVICGLIFLVVLFYISFEVSDTMGKRNQEYALQEQRHALLEEYYKQVEAHQNEVRTIKHDMKNQLLALAGTIERNDAGRAAGQIQELVGQLSAGDDTSFTTNPGMNALLGAKYRLAQAEGIVCDFTVKLPTETGIKENDLAAVVGNVLDNAIEACRYVEGQRYIQFKMVYHGNALVLSCENSTDGHAETATRKGDTRNHGKGLQSIRQTVDRYNGNMQYAFHPHSFSLELTMFAQKA